MPSLWDNPTAVRTLARIVFGIAQIPPTISYHKMSDSIKSEGSTIINQQNIRNFAIRNTYKFASIHDCEAMIKYILNILQHDQNQATKRFIKECIDEYDIVGAYSMRDQIAQSPHPVQTYIAGDAYTSTLGLMKNFFNISLDSFEKVSSLFTTCGKRLPHISRDQDRGFYICYRYSSRPGMVAKSFMVVFPPDASSPFCLFKHFYKDISGNDRISQGVLILLDVGAYFIGRISDGAALKIIAMPRPYGHMDKYFGLLLSLDSSNLLVSARITLKKTDIKHSSQASIGIYPEETIASDMLDIRESIKNYVDFRLIESIYKYGIRIEQNHLVTTVHDRLHDEKSKPILSDTSGNLFNPASHDRYTFNSALQCYYG